MLSLMLSYNQLVDCLKRRRPQWWELGRGAKPELSGGGGEERESCLESPKFTKPSLRAWGEIVMLLPSLPGWTRLNVFEEIVCQEWKAPIKASLKPLFTPLAST